MKKLFIAAGILIVLAGIAWHCNHFKFRPGIYYAPNDPNRSKLKPVKDTTTAAMRRLPLTNYKKIAFGVNRKNNHLIIFGKDSTGYHILDTAFSLAKGVSIRIFGTGKTAFMQIKDPPIPEYDGIVAFPVEDFTPMELNGISQDGNRVIISGADAYLDNGSPVSLNDNEPVYYDPIDLEDSIYFRVRGMTNGTNFTDDFPVYSAKDAVPFPGKDLNVYLQLFDEGNTLGIGFYPGVPKRYYIWR